MCFVCSGKRLFVLLVSIACSVYEGCKFIIAVHQKMMPRLLIAACLLAVALVHGCKFAMSLVRGLAASRCNELAQG